MPGGSLGSTRGPCLHHDVENRHALASKLVLATAAAAAAIAAA
jgi:hypothetical protein